MQDNSETKSKYGLLSLISIIIGTVIGSGIYVKNGSLMETANSSILVMIGWLVGGLLVLSILVCFFEINSITNKKDEQGTFSNYGEFLFSKRTGRIIGLFYIVVYFPYIIAAKGIFSSEKMFSSIESLSGMNPWMSWFILTLTSFGLIALITSIIIASAKTTKRSLVSGTFIKVLPLIFIVFLMFLVLFGLSIGNADQLNPIFDPNAPINEGLNNNALLNLFLILPPIMFTFDGFLYVNSLSKESKSKKIFKSAAIISVLFIILIYLLFSLSSMLLAQGNAFDIIDILNDLFPYASWLVNLIIFIIVISIATAAMSSTLTGTYTYSSASETYQISDYSGSLIKRNRQTTPYSAALILMVSSFLWLLLMRVFDGLGLAFVETSQQLFYIGMTDYITNVGSTINFIIYAILIVGAWISRKKDKNEVDRERLFYPAATIAVVLISLVTISNVYEIGNEIFASDQFQIGIIQFSYLATLLGIYGIAILLNEWTLKRNQDKEYNPRKELMVDAYRKHVAYRDIDFSILDHY